MKNNNGKYKYEALDENEKSGVFDKAKLDEHEANAYVVNNYKHLSQATTVSRSKLGNLKRELDVLDKYLATIEMAANYNQGDLEKAKVGVAKDMFNLRWQDEFSMFATSGFNFVLDSLLWTLWNFDYDSELIEDKLHHLEDVIEDYKQSSSYRPKEDSKPHAHQPIPPEVLALWTEGKATPNKHGSTGFHKHKSPIAKLGSSEIPHRGITWTELINPLVDLKGKNVHVGTPKFEDEDEITVGHLAALFLTTPFEIMKMFSEDVLRTDSPQNTTPYLEYSIKGSVLNNFVDSLMAYKELHSLEAYYERMTALHNGQQSLDL
tara:strand:+ start:3757 stop:4716 length:960 start_codon:yes stop_codon:yes gene_type:complete